MSVSLIKSRTTTRVRCDQNRVFGCGRLTSLSVTRYVIGRDRQREMAGGPCQHCGLPLAIARDAL